ncbi:MOSC domain-containing protein [Natronorarus salvus]|uniref:MOSC domain-containing protein n=1 Tax=Natronorarus salvus TaxID=3117733 RepID=UPI002F2695B9
MDPHLARIAVYPIKSLDPRDRKRTEVIENGALAGDREYAIRGDEGDYVNGKRERQTHRLRTAFDGDTIELRKHGDDEGVRFDPETDREALSAWLSDFFGYPVTLDREPAGGFPDDAVLSGPTVVSTATLETVAGWFGGISTSEMRRRLRANLEIGGVPAFWEDRFYAEPGSVVAFAVGEVEFEGVTPCQRCVVPSRDPDTGEEYDGFRHLFVEKRRETLPAWAAEGRFDHHFRLMVNTRVPEASWGRELHVGDEVRVLGERPE